MLAGALTFLIPPTAAKSKISFLRVPENYFMDPKVRGGRRCVRAWPGHGSPSAYIGVLSQQKLNINPPYGNVIKRG